MDDNKGEKEKINKIKSIIEREIEKELVNKQNEVSDISEKIKNVLRNLELLKYVVAVSYYDQNPVLAPKKGQDDGFDDEKAQNQIHPCVKNLLPFKGNYEKSIGNGLGTHSYETRRSKKTVPGASKSVEVKNEVAEESGNTQQCTKENNCRVPQYVPPLPNGDDKVASVNSTGGDASKERFRVIVGNVSKWLSPDTREDISTHKWMVYIRNKDETRDVMKHLKKVRYFLHESYKPHDIIDVTSPFQLTRRGWGEFPIRVQLHFNHPLNKPVDIIHNLKLDMTCSGVQMLGAETVVEVALHSSVSSATTKDSKKSNELSIKKEKEVVVVEGKREKQDVFDGSLLMNLNGIKTAGNGSGDVKGFVLDGIIKQEPEDVEETNCQQLINEKLEEIKLALYNSRKFLLDRRKAMKIIEIEHNYLPPENPWDNAIPDFAKSHLRLDSSSRCQAESGEPFKNDVLQADSVSTAQVLEQKGRLHGAESASGSNEAEVFNRLKNAVKEVEADVQSKNYVKVFRHAYLVNLLQRAQATNLRSVEGLVQWFASKWPVVTALSLDPVYRVVHPYSCFPESEFFKYNIGKQRSAEWFRAKAIQKVLRTLKTVIPIDEEIWTTKQILLWCRFHGYFPLSPVPSVSSAPPAAPSTSTAWPLQIKSEPEDGSECRVERSGRSNDSSSDSDDGLEQAIASKLCGNQCPNGSGTTGEKKRNFKKNRKKETGQERDMNKKDMVRVINYKGVNTYTDHSSDATRFGAADFRTIQAAEDETIEVVEVEKPVVNESPSKRKKEPEMSVRTIPPSDLSFNRFVCETARQIGIKITDEEVVPGVRCDSVSRVLSRSVSCFVEELVRRSCAQAWLRNGERRPDSVELNDLLGALIENPKFDIFTNRGLGQDIPGTTDA